jgi:predicted secreted protein
MTSSALNQELPGGLAAMKILWHCVFLASLLAVLPLAAAQAAAGPVTLEEKDRGRTVTLKAGQRLIINLRNPASGGYTATPPVFDSGILKLISQEKKPPAPQKPPRLGDFGLLCYEWEALSPGETDIVINIHRPWEKKPPQEFWRVKVLVK